MYRSSHAEQSAIATEIAWSGSSKADGDMGNGVGAKRSVDCCQGHGQGEGEETQWSGGQYESLMKRILLTLHQIHGVATLAKGLAAQSRCKPEVKHVEEAIELYAQFSEEVDGGRASA